MNSARLEHLASLELPLEGRRVLEVGAGIGLMTGFLLDRGCSVLSTDGRVENVTEMKRRFPDREVARLDLEEPDDLPSLGTFDVVYCYGTLYHLSNPAESLAALAGVSSMILVETCCSPALGEEVVFVDEQAHTVNQARSGVGCRPTRDWVLARLGEGWGNAYTTATQPRHPEFPLDWDQSAAAWDPKVNVRAVFVGSRDELHLPSLVRTPLQQQASI